jgi:hypothetical protein
MIQIAEGKRTEKERTLLLLAHYYYLLSCSVHSIQSFFLFNCSFLLPKKETGLPRFYQIYVPITQKKSFSKECLALTN